MSKTYARQEGPFCIQIELCEGCNLRCTFCGLQGIRAPGEKNYKFMQPETLRRVLTDVVTAGWNPRLEFAMRGEPTMHPDYVGMIRVARESAPRLQIMMTSNAGGLLRKPGAALNVLDLFNAGLNVLALDDYEGAGYVPKVRAAIEATPICVPTYEYPDDKRGNPHMRRPLSAKVLVFVRDILAATKGNHATLTNHAGCGGPALKEPLVERCAKPFRELGIRWDGSVAMCCNDWRGVWKCGNVNQTNVAEIWSGPAFGSARELLYAGDRTHGACVGCDYHTYRNGLLPDKMGKLSMPEPDEATRTDAARACFGEPLTKANLNPWEQ